MYNPYKLLEWSRTLEQHRLSFEEWSSKHVTDDKRGTHAQTELGPVLRQALTDQVLPDRRRDLRSRRSRERRMGALLGVTHTQEVSLDPR